MEDVRPSFRKALQDTAKFVGFLFACMGWVWFASMMFLKFSGATIYATTEQSVIEVVDPAWKQASEASSIYYESGSGLRFIIKIQGIQPDSPSSTN